MPPLDKFATEVTAEEAAAGFSVCRDPDRISADHTTALSVIHSWGDPSHRLVKMLGRDGRTVFQLQAFGRPRSSAGPPGWFAERYWPATYGPAWVIDQLREHFGRPGYEALIELHEAGGDEESHAPAGSRTDATGSDRDGPVNCDGTGALDLGSASKLADSEPAACGTTGG
jgi:hypothetical protein